MKGAYYYLIAGLPDLSFPALNKAIRLEHIPLIEQTIEENVSSSDRESLAYFLYVNDNRNLMRAIEREKGETLTHPEFSTPAAFSENAIAAYRSISDAMPAYMKRFIEEYGERITETPSRTLERALLEGFYAEAARSKSAFIRAYFEFDLRARNALAAFNARKLRRDTARAVIGEDEITDLLTKSSARDFGLGAAMPFAQTLADAFENDAYASLDEFVDAARFEMADEVSRRDHFSSDALFAYVLKLSIVRNVMARDAEKGRARLQTLIDAMKERYRIPV